MGLCLFHHPLPLEKDLSSNPMLLLHHHYVDVCCWMVSIKTFSKTPKYKTIGCFDKITGCFPLSLKNTLILKDLKTLKL